MHAVQTQEIPSQNQDLNQLLELQQEAFLEQPYPTRAERINRLDRLHNALIDYRAELIAAVTEDFSSRPLAETELAEFMPLFEGIAYYRKRLKKLMRAQKRHVPLALMPASAEVHYQPVGVVGIVAPWNFPIFLALSPLIGALAAGNRAIIKMSEFAPVTGQLLEKVIEETFDRDEVTVVNGGVDVASEFTKLPFDHLVFTGSTQVGRMVMKAAAENLTPVTLELGGKSPVIIHEDFPIEEAANRIAFGKAFNAGQVCVSPDYILCPENKVDAFCSAFEKAIETSYPSVGDNSDFTAIITDRQKKRLESYLVDAKDKGADLITINPKSENFNSNRKLPITLVIGANDDMQVMKDEIFGPILPVLPYKDIESAVEKVNRRDRPLALYYFDWDKGRAEDILKNTHSGGVCINDTMSHVMVDDIPFGGIGPSGIGHYHGEEGFRTFSKTKGVVRKGRINATAFVAPPWSNFAFKSVLALQALRFRRRSVKRPQK